MHIQFSIEISDVGLNRRYRDAHFFACLRIASPAGEVPEQLEFFRSELSKIGGFVSRAREFEKIAGERWADGVIPLQRLL